MKKKKTDLVSVKENTSSSCAYEKPEACPEL